jgi:glycosyltransferase involved in cell wall biosynthesis
LWFLRSDPKARDNGESIYSAGLIDGFAAVGVKIEVVCLGMSAYGQAPESRACNGVRWHLVPGPENARWMSVASSLPHIAHRCATESMRKTAAGYIERDGWDIVVIDGLSMGWVVPLLRAQRRGRSARPLLVHISHNHEESTRAEFARALPTVSPYKLFAANDARKAARLERMVVDRVDLLTAITPEDRTLFAQFRKDRSILVLTPGYAGRHIEARRITDQVQRSVLIMGSFDWIAKQRNLVDFLELGAPRFAAAGIGIRVVGGGAPRFLASLRRRFTTVSFTGHVGDVTPELEAARIAIVPERFGGGFKLKLLDLVFNRVPIAALQGAMNGIPLRHGDSSLTYPDRERLVAGVLNAIDNIDLLNRLHDGAYRSCKAKFDWASRGAALLSAVAAR